MYLITNVVQTMQDRHRNKKIKDVTNLMPQSHVGVKLNDIFDVLLNSSIKSLSSKQSMCTVVHLL